MALNVVNPSESSNLSIPRGNLGIGPSSSSRCCSGFSSCARPRSARSRRAWWVFKRLNAECAISVMLFISTSRGAGPVVLFWRGAGRAGRRVLDGRGGLATTRRGSIPDPGTVESARLDCRSCASTCWMNWSKSLIGSRPNSEETQSEQSASHSWRRVGLWNKERMQTDLVDGWFLVVLRDPRTDALMSGHEENATGHVLWYASDGDVAAASARARHCEDARRLSPLHPAAPPRRRAQRRARLRRRLRPPAGPRQGLSRRSCASCTGSSSRTRQGLSAQLA